MNKNEMVLEENGIRFDFSKGEKAYKFDVKCYSFYSKWELNLRIQFLENGR